jgi:FkbM family methyltransferase
MFNVLMLLRKLNRKVESGVNMQLQKNKKFTEERTRRHEIKQFTDFGFAVNEDENGYNISQNETDLYIRKNSSDVAVFNQVYLCGEYQTLINLLSLNYVSPSVIIDAGSNIGLASAQFKKAFPHSTLFAFEPDPENFKQLQLNLRNFTNCTLMQKAIWNTDTTLYLDNNFRDGLDWSRSVSPHNTTKNPVEAVSINSVIKSYDIDTIDLLKIDVEGSEATIFQLASDVTFLQKTKVIAIEIHDEFNCRDNIYDILKTNNFLLINSHELTIGINKSFIK